MKRLSACAVFAVCLAGFWTCRAARAQYANLASPANPRLHVVAAETFLQDIAQNVAKDRTHVESLMAHGVDPHEYQPTPADVQKVAECQVLILNGGGLEAFQQELLRNAGGHPIVVDASKGLPVRAAHAGEAAEMSSEDVADEITGIAGGAPQAATAMLHADVANPLPADGKVFDVKLTRLADGTFGGCVAYRPSDGGLYALAIGAGQVQTLLPPGPGAVIPDKTIALTAGNLKHGYVVALDGGGKYVLSLSGFAAPSTSLVIAQIGEEHEAGDPHFWLDPNNVIQYVINIRDGLSMADPFWAATYKKNAEEYIAKLKDLDAWIRQEAQQVPPDRRLLVTNHDEFGYFADRYGFKVVGAIIPSFSTDASTSPKELARLVDRIRQTGAPAIFMELEANDKLAQQVARETGVKLVSDVITHWTTGPEGPAPTYIEMMRHMVRQIVDALKP